MKKPQYPHQPKAPKKPLEYIEIVYYEKIIPDGLSVYEIIELISDDLGYAYMDIDLEKLYIDRTYQYQAEENVIEASYECNDTIENPNYEEELVDYNIAKAQYDKQMIKYQNDLAEWTRLNREYLELEERKEFARLQKYQEENEKRLKYLSSKYSDLNTSDLNRSEE